MTNPANASAATWLVVEPQFDGHHYTYLEHIVSGLLARGTRVIVGIGDDAEQGGRTRSALERRFGRAIDIVTAPMPAPARRLPGIARLVLDELRRRHFLRRILERATAVRPVDHVFLVFFDWSLFAIAVRGTPFGRVPFSGITMRQRFHLREQGVKTVPEPLQEVKGRLFRRLLRMPTLTRVFTNDETMGEYFAGSDAPGAGKVVHIADPTVVHPAPSRSAARAELSLPGHSCVVLLYGFLDARKGVRALLQWLAGSAKALDVTALVVGQQDPEIAALLAAPEASALVQGGRLRIIDGFAPEADEPRYFAAADLVWLGYDRFEMMSGVLVKAAQYGRAVIFHDYGLIAHYARKHGDPYTATDNGCARAVASLPPDLIVRDFGPPAARGALPDHSWSNAIHLIHD